MARPILRAFEMCSKADTVFLKVFLKAFNSYLNIAQILALGSFKTCVKMLLKVV